MPATKAPKVFLSHASEDKKRFVIPFATELRKQGIEVWLDKWEILPGDSLVDKIFEEGLKEADAVIVVLSRLSVEKPWVKEELNAAVVGRIAKKTKLIPVVIDDCEIPESLRSLVWERVADMNNFGPELGRVVAAIFEHYDKPALGTAPSYLAERLQVPGLTTADTVVLRALYDEAVSGAETYYRWDAAHLPDQLESLQAEQILDALEILEHQGYLEIVRVLGGMPRGISIIQPTLSGFLIYANTFMPRIEDDVRRTALSILNERAQSDSDVEKATGLAPFVIDQILSLFESRRWVQLTRTMGATHILGVSPLLKRQFE